MTADTTDVTEEMETTIRIAVSLRWGDAFDADIARQIAEQVGADRSACLQGPSPAEKNSPLPAGGHVGFPSSEGNASDLTGTLDAVASTGARRIELVGWSAQDGPVPISWLRRVSGNWVRNHPDAAQVVVYAGTVRLGQEMDDDWRTVTGNEAPLRSVVWEEFPPFRHHLLVCRGPRCCAQGAVALHDVLHNKLVQADAIDTEVLVTVTGCMFPCNHAPLVVIWPDGKCLRLTEDSIDEIVRDLSAPQEASLTASMPPPTPDMR